MFPMGINKTAHRASSSSSSPQHGGRRGGGGNLLLTIRDSVFVLKKRGREKRKEKVGEGFSRTRLRKNVGPARVGGSAYIVAEGAGWLALIYHRTEG
jgi:hypothetical protein